MEWIQPEGHKKLQGRLKDASAWYHAISGFISLVVEGLIFF